MTKNRWDGCFQLTIRKNPMLFVYALHSLHGHTKGLHVSTKWVPLKYTKTTENMLSSILLCFRKVSLCSNLNPF